MKRISLLLTMMLLTTSVALAGNATFNLGVQSGLSTPEGFFTHSDGKWNFNSKYNGGEYDGITFSMGLKMEGSTAIYFTTEDVSTVTIVQSTWNENTITFDGTELSVSSAEKGTGCRIYTLEEVSEGTHTIARGSGESGLFYVEVEGEMQNDYMVRFQNDQSWEHVYAYIWNEELMEGLDIWPGREMTLDEDGNYVLKFSWNYVPTTILFNNGDNIQTEDLEFVNDGLYNSSGPIVEQNEYTVTFTTDAGWTNVNAYTWTGEDMKQLGEWPGTAMTEVSEGVWTITIQAVDAPANISFNGGSYEEETPSMTFTDGRPYKWNTTLKPLFPLEPSDYPVPAGTTIEMKDDGEVVATLTYGDGGADFAAPVSCQNEEYAGFSAYTTGNGSNGNSEDGTKYFIASKVDGIITVGVFLRANKALYIEEDGEPLDGFNGLKRDYDSSTAFEFPVKEGCVYQLYCTGSKLGFFGFDLKYEKETVTPGDANDDGKLDADDIVEIVNYLMNKPSANFIFKAADMNMDNKVDIADIIQIANTIIGTK